MMMPNEQQIRRYGMFALVAFNVVLLLWVLISYFTFQTWTEKLPNGQQGHSRLQHLSRPGSKGRFSACSPAPPRSTSAGR